MGIKHQLTVPVWLSLSRENRSKLTGMFTIKKSTTASFTQAGGIGTVTSDGHTNDDLSVITVERIAEILKEPVNQDFWASFERLLSFLNDDGKHPVVVPEKEVPPITKKYKKDEYL